MKTKNYTRPQGTNKFDKYATGRDVHPLEVDYKRFKPGGRVRMRFMNLDDDVAVALEGREVSILNRQTGAMMSIKVEIPCDEHGEPLSEVEKMVDHSGVPVLAQKETPIFRMPVWVYFEEDDRGVITEVSALRYLEFTQGLRVSMDQMKEWQQGVGAFNEDTGRPDYDVDLRVIKGEGTISKNYRFDVVYLDSKTKKQHPNFGVEADEVLAEVLDVIDEEWPAVIEAMNRRITLQEFERRLAPPKENSRGLSAKPGLNRGEDEADPTDESEDDGSEDTVTRPTRPVGRKYGPR